MQKLWTLGVIGLCLSGYVLAATADGGDAAWQRGRENRYSANRAANPDLDAKIAQIKTKTAALIAASAATPSAKVDAAPVVWRTSKRPVELWDGVDAPEMVVVPAGDYAMGSAITQPNRDAAEGPLHRVRISYAFAVSKYPVTVGEYARFVADAKHDAGDRCYTSEDGVAWKETLGRDWRRPGFDQTQNSPAVCTNWNDAKAYVAWLSAKTGHAYRLLSEAEYEYANRAGTTSAYWWGDDPAVSCRYANGSDLSLKTRYPAVTTSTCRDGFAFTAPVTRFKPNAFGLYDTTGNVWSWVEDCWNDDYRSTPTDGSPSKSGDCSRKLLRGGSWYYYPRNLRAADRYGNMTEPRVNMDGFRVAFTL